MGKSQQDHVSTIDDFIATTRELSDINSRYTQQLLQGEIGGSFSFSGGVPSSSRRGPDEESLKSVFLTLRMFLQDNESISIRNMSKMFANLKLDSQLTAPFESIRSDLNRFLDNAPSGVSPCDEGHKLTHREIMKAYLYGKYAHLNSKYTVTIKRWEERGIEGITRYVLDEIVGSVIAKIAELGEACRPIKDEVLKLL